MRHIEKRIKHGVFFLKETILMAMNLKKIVCDGLIEITIVGFRNKIGTINMDF